MKWLKKVMMIMKWIVLLINGNEEYDESNEMMIILMIM